MMKEYGSYHEVSSERTGHKPPITQGDQPDNTAAGTGAIIDIEALGSQLPAAERLIEEIVTFRASHEVGAITPEQRLAGDRVAYAIRDAIRVGALPQDSTGSMRDLFPGPQDRGTDAAVNTDPRISNGVLNHTYGMLASESISDGEHLPVDELLRDKNTPVLDVLEALHTLQHMGFLRPGREYGLIADLNLMRRMKNMENEVRARIELSEEVTPETQQSSSDGDTIAGRSEIDVLRRFVSEYKGVDIKTSYAVTRALNAFDRVPEKVMKDETPESLEVPQTLEKRDSLGRQLALELYARIAKDLSLQRLPTERELTETTGYARITVREAIKQLEFDGIVHVHHGLGTEILGRENIPHLGTTE